MFAVVRRYTFDKKHSAEIDQKVRDEFVPLVRKAKGFITYHWLDNGDGIGISMGVFEDEAGADESVHLAADYVAEHLAHLLGHPEITKGEVKAYA